MSLIDLMDQRFGGGHKGTPLSIWGGGRGLKCWPFTQPVSAKRPSQRCGDEPPWRQGTPVPPWHFFVPVPCGGADLLKKKHVLMVRHPIQRGCLLVTCCSWPLLANFFPGCLLVMHNKKTPPCHITTPRHTSSHYYTQGCLFIDQGTSE